MLNALLQTYHTRMLKVLVYIDAHLDEDLSLERLAEVAAFSKFHFHRQFHALFGLTLHRYVQLNRLKRASYRLIFRRECEIIELAFDSHYEGPEAFARAFKQHVGQTPSQFRDNPDWKPWYDTFQPIQHIWRETMTTTFDTNQIEIIDFPQTRIGVLRHVGDYATIGDSIGRFIAWRKQAGLPPATNATYTILYDDPETTPPEDYRTDLCVATDNAIGENGYGVVAGVLPAGKCARLRVKGDGNVLKQAIVHLYGDWMPSSGYTPRDKPPFVQRLLNFPDVPEHEATVDLFVPVE